MIVLADLQQEVAGAGELQHMRVSTTITTDPDVVHVVEGDTVVGIGPVITLTWAAPVADQVAFLIELKDRRCRKAAFRRLRRVERRWHLVGPEVAAMHNPDVVT